MSEWPCVVARPLTGDESRELQGALSVSADAYRDAEPVDAVNLDRCMAAERVVRVLLAAVREGRICIEAEDEPTAEELRDDHELISDDQWDAIKEERR